MDATISLQVGRNWSGRKGKKAAGVRDGRMDVRDGKCQEKHMPWAFLEEFSLNGSDQGQVVWEAHVGSCSLKLPLLLSEVLGIDGEGLSLTVPRQMLGRDLSRLEWKRVELAAGGVDGVDTQEGRGSEVSL